MFDVWWTQDMLNQVSQDIIALMDVLCVPFRSSISFAHACYLLNLFFLVSHIVSLVNRLIQQSGCIFFAFWHFYIKPPIREWFVLWPINGDLGYGLWHGFSPIKDIKAQGALMPSLLPRRQAQHFFGGRQVCHGGHVANTWRMQRERCKCPSTSKDISLNKWLIDLEIYIYI